MDIVVTPAVVVDLRDEARPGPQGDERVPESAVTRVELWYASLEVPSGLEGMYYCG